LGYSADGDSRELKVIKELLQLVTKSWIFEKKQRGFVSRFCKHKSHFKTPSMKEKIKNKILENRKNFALWTPSHLLLTSKPF
jgi:hypothetical protein